MISLVWAILFAGINLNENLDLEFAFNKFGETIMSCNNNDTVKTDGKYQNGGNAAGTTLTCNAAKSLAFFPVIVTKSRP